MYNKNMKDLEQFIGIPFVNMGRTIKGCDCWGLITLIYQHYLAIYLPTYVIDQFNIDKVKQAFISEKARWSKVERSQVNQFDVAELVVRTNSGKLEPLHVGVIVDNTYLLHTEKNIGSHLVKFNEDFRIKSRLINVWRYNADS